MTNYLLVNLAVADMLLCLQEIFLYLTSPDCRFVLKISNGRELYCQLLDSEFLAWALAHVSAYNLCLVTLERYVAIKHPLQYETKLTAKRMKYLITLIWVSSFLFASPYIFMTEPNSDPDEPACFEVKDRHLRFRLLFSVFSILVG